MHPFIRTLLIAALLLLPASLLQAQTAVDPSGHWEGLIKMPEMDMAIEIDLAKNAKGVLAGTFAQPAQGLKGLPLSTVAVEGRSIRLVLKDGERSSTFEAVLAADGKSMAGNASQGAFSAPFTLTRTGDARIAPAPKSAPIGKELEGTWKGTLDAGERQMRVVVKMTNHADGTATGTMMSPDGSGVEIPIAMRQTANDITIEAPSVGLSYTAVLSAAKTELAGTWTQGPTVLPLTLTREKP